MNRDIRSMADVLTLLDGFFTRDADWWDARTSPRWSCA